MNAVSPKREFPTSLALLKRTEEYPKSGPYGQTTGFMYSNDELAALLSELSKHIAVAVSEIEHSPDGDTTSMRISIYITLARSEYPS